MSKHVTHFIAGKSFDGAAARQGVIRDPATGEESGRVDFATAAEVDAAVAAASAAARDWAESSLAQRTRLLFAFRELLDERRGELAAIVSSEHGKTRADADGEVARGLEVVELACGIGHLLKGSFSEGVSRGVDTYSLRQPLGVVCGITPFNFPAMVPLWMFPIAVTLGNAFVLKPSEKVPLTSCRMAELMDEAGFPAGVFNVVHGGRTAVDALVDHPDVSAYAFVGSSKVAQMVYARAASLGKRVLALGGAKNTMILVPDASPELSVSGVVASFTGCAGQRCMAGSVLAAVGDCDALIDAIVAAAGRIQLGRDMGAIIDAASLERLERAIARGSSEGATLRLDGRRPTPPRGCERGHWLAPTILDHVAPGSFCAREELFGPVLSIVRVPTLEAALELERASPYGNATSVFTQSGAVARLVSERATSGMVGVNVGVPVPREPFSFGGTKRSRFGHGDITGMGGVELWTHLKKVTTKWAKVEGGGSHGSWMS